MHLLVNPGMPLQYVMIFSALQYAVSGSCIYEGTQYPEGDTTTSNPCEVIQCHQGHAMRIVADCVEDLMPHLWVCANPVKKPGQCCSSCLSGECKMREITFQDGDSLPNGDCTKMCKCNSGQLSECSTITLPPCPPQGCFPEEDNLQYTKEFPGCPPPCAQCPPGCTYLDVRYGYGDMVISANCTQMCICGRTGKLSDCAQLPECPADGCLTTEQHQSYQRNFPGCPPPCAICEAGCTYLDVLYGYGDKVTFANCTQQCICGRTGELSSCATLPECPPDGCLTTEEHQSYQRNFPGCPPPCVICEAGCTYSGSYRDIVVSADCTQMCICGRTGELSDCAPLPECPSDGCPTIEQFQSYQQAFSGCLPRCATCCLYKGNLYPLGGIPSSDPCHTIGCVGGMVLEGHIDCIEFMREVTWLCPHLVKADDQCCSSCPSGECHFNGQIYHDGDTFMYHQCLRCTCKNGMVFMEECQQVIPPCPEERCIQDAAQFSINFPGCPLPCPECEGGQRDCEHLRLPGCPPDGCLTTEQHQSYQQDFPGCPLPCRICEAGINALQCKDGLVYRSQTSPCPATCENPNAENECNRPQAEGCVCPLRTILKGGTCVPYIDCVCNPNPCKNGGICMAQLSYRGVRYVCRCLSPYAGIDCQFRKHTAKANGDPQHFTFDGAWIPFQGYNTYVLSQTKTGSSMPPFKIYATGEYPPWGGTRYTVVKSIVVKLYGQTVHIERQGDYSYEVKIGDVVIDPASYVFPPQFQIYETGMSIYLETDSDVTGMVLIASLSNADSYVASVTISHNYAGEVEGIFGNCDNDVNNDLVTSDGTDVSSEENMYDLIGESWEITGRKKRSNPSASVSTPACRNETKELVKSSTYCGLLTDATGPFISCLASGLVDTTNTYKACEYDMCAYQDTLEEGRVLACSYLSDLAVDCGERGFPPQPWRSLSACDITRPAGMTYKASTNACPNTCENQFAEDECHLSDRERCACPDGEFQHNGSCVAACVKETACIAVAVDLSESIDESAAKNEEADFLHALGEALTSTDRLSRYHLELNYFPFNEGVLVNETKVIKTNRYTTKGQFLAEEKRKWNAIKEDVRNKDTGRLTDLSALFTYVATGLNCDGDVKGLIVVSDFIVTLNHATLSKSLQNLHDLRYKVMAVGLSKERSERDFRKVGAAPSIVLDLREAGWESRLFETALDSFLGDNST